MSRSIFRLVAVIFVLMLCAAPDGLAKGNGNRKSHHRNRQSKQPRRQKPIEVKTSGVVTKLGAQPGEKGIGAAAGSLQGRQQAAFGDATAPQRTANANVTEYFVIENARREAEARAAAEAEAESLRQLLKPRD